MLQAQEHGANCRQFGTADRLPDDTQITALDALALSGAIKSRRLSCVEVMDAFLDRIELLNPRVNAIVSLQPRDLLRRQAQQRDAQLARGEPCGPLHGLPAAIKDLEATEGIRTTLGSPLFRDFVPRTDSIGAERIKRAGAIVIGKTNFPNSGSVPTRLIPSSAPLSMPTISPGPPGAAAGEPRWLWLSGCCRLRMAAIMRARYVIRRRSTTSSDFALLSVGFPPTGARSSRRRSPCMARWHAIFPTLPCALGDGGL